MRVEARRPSSASSENQRAKAALSQWGLESSPRLQARAPGRLSISLGNCIERARAYTFAAREQRKERGEGAITRLFLRSRPEEPPTTSPHFGARCAEKIQRESLVARLKTQFAARIPGTRKAPMVSLTAASPSRGHRVPLRRRRRSKWRVAGTGERAPVDPSLSLSLSLRSKFRRNNVVALFSLASSNAAGRRAFFLPHLSKNPRRARAGGGATRSRGSRELPLEKCAGGSARERALGLCAGGEGARVVVVDVSEREQEAEGEELLSSAAGKKGRVEEHFFSVNLACSLALLFHSSTLLLSSQERKKGRKKNMNFRFTNLLGAPYRGGTILLSKGDSLLAPVGNRVNEVRGGVEVEQKKERKGRRRAAEEADDWMPQRITAVAAPVVRHVGSWMAIERSNMTPYVRDEADRALAASLRRGFRRCGI